VTTINSLLPGHLVSALVTSIIPATGLNLKIFGTFDATVDLTHLPIPANSDLEDHYKIGKKVRARIIFETTPAGVGEGKVFGVSLMPHVLDGTSPVVDGKEVEREMTIGTVCEKVEVMAVEKEWGLVVQTEQGYRGFVHVSSACIRFAS
jgi:rRNA biogenesis protein RRP5